MIWVTWPGVVAADLAVVEHHAGALLDRLRVPVLPLAAPLVHRVEADVPPRGRLDEQSRPRDALALLLHLGVEGPLELVAARLRARARRAGGGSGPSSRTSRARRSRRTRSSARGRSRGRAGRPPAAPPAAPRSERRKWISIRSPLWPSSVTGTRRARRAAPHGGEGLRRLGGEPRSQVVRRGPRQSGQRTRNIWCRTLQPSSVSGTRGSCMRKPPPGERSILRGAGPGGENVRFGRFTEALRRALWIPLRLDGE